MCFRRIRLQHVHPGQIVVFVRLRYLLNGVPCSNPDLVSDGFLTVFLGPCVQILYSQFVVVLLACSVVERTVLMQRLLSPPLIVISAGSVIAELQQAYILTFPNTLFWYIFKWRTFQQDASHLCFRWTGTHLLCDAISYLWYSVKTVLTLIQLPFITEVKERVELCLCSPLWGLRRVMLLFVSVIRLLLNPGAKL